MSTQVRRRFRDNMNWRRFRDYFDTTIMAQAFRGDKEALSSGFAHEYDEAKRLSDFVALITSVFACLFGFAFFGHLSQNATNHFDSAALQGASLISLAMFAVLQYRALRIIALWFLVGPTGTSTGPTQKIIRVFLIVSSMIITLQASWSIFLASRRLVFESPLLK